MSRWSSLLAISLTLATKYASGLDHEWLGGTSGDWNTAANWTNGVPSLVTDTAIFDQNSSNTTVNISGLVGINSLTFDTTIPYTIIASPAQLLQLGGSSPAINVLAGNQLMNLPFQFVPNGTINLSPGASLTLGSVATLQSLTTVITGEGNLTILMSSQSYNVTNLVINSGNVLNQYLGGGLPTTLLTINGGTVTNQGDFSNGGMKTVINGGTIYNSSTGTISYMTNEIDINGGTIYNQGTIAESGPQAFVINGGTIYNQSGGTLANTIASMTMNGGTLVNQGGTIGLSTNLITINGGTVDNQNGASIGLSTNQLVINGGSVNNIEGSLLHAGKVTINGGTVTNSAVLQGIGGSVNLLGGVLDNSGSVIARPLYNQGPNGTYILEIQNTSTFGFIDALRAQLDGTLLVGALPGFDVQPGQQIVFLTAPLFGVTGTYSTVAGINLPDLLPVVTYGATEVIVSFTPTLFTYPNLAESIFASINHVNLGVSRRMDILHTQMGVSKTTPSQERNTVFLLTDASDAPNPEVEQKQEVLKQTITSEQKRRFNVYAGPLGSVGRVNTRSAQVGYNYSSIGGLVGMDYAFTKVGIGILADYEYINAPVKHSWGHFDINQLHGSAYATYAPVKEFAVNAIVGGSYDWYKIDRKAGNTPAKAKGSPKGSEFDALLGVEYTGQIATTAVMPYLSAQYIHLTVHGYNEKNGGLYNLKVKSQDVKSLRSMLGMRINHVWTWGDFKLQPELNVAWQKEFLDKSRLIGVSPIEIVGPANTVTLPQVGRNTGLAGLNLLFTLYDRYGIEANYDYEWNKSFEDNFFFVGFNVRF